MSNPDSDLYSDSPAPDSGGDGGGNDGGSGQTAMLNKAVLGGRDIKAGEEITLTVVKDHGDEVEVSCSGSVEKQEASQKPEGGGEIRSMLED